ncbi:MAG: hypothetical protein AB7T10_04385 [bacterium]
MKKTGLLVLVLLFLFSSCGLTTNSDEENLNDLILEFHDILLSTYETGEEEDAVKTSITPIFWYRDKSETDSVSHSIQFDLEGDSAIAVIKVIFPGTMNIHYVNDSLDTVVCEKTFVDTLIRSVMFLKDTLKEYHGGWRVAKITGAEIYTMEPPLMHIDSVKLYKTGIIDTMIMGVGEFFPKNEFITLPKGEAIEITVYSPDTTGFFYIHSALRRSKCVYSDGVYSGTFRVPLISGTYRAAFDGLTEYSLLDSDSAYSSYGWMLPYKSE